MSIGIYKITNKINNKVYIGKSVSIEKRWEEHIRESLVDETIWLANKRGEQTHLHRAMRKWKTKENIFNTFSFEIIELCEKEFLNEREKFWIKKFNSFQNGYNMTEGGDGYNFGKGENAITAKITQEQCDFIKQKLKERWTAKQILEYIPNISDTTISDINYGKTWFDPNETYPISINNGHRQWSDEEALKIKEEWANGKNIQTIADELKVSRDTISNLINGKTYTNLPKIERKVSYKRTNNKHRKFSNEDIIKWRAMCYEDGRSILNIFQTENPPCCYAAFRNLIRGITYANVPGVPNDR